MSQTDFLSIKEFASLLRVHPDTVRRGIKRGRISGFKVGGGKRSIYRIPCTETNRMAICDMEAMVDKMVEKRIQNNPKVL